MLFQNSSSPPEGTPCSSEVSPPHQPVERAKHRSIVPTVLGLLVDVMADRVISNTHSVELHPRKSATSKRYPNLESGWRSLDGSCSNERLWNEDILVREDEDGVRSQYCPLDEDRVAERPLDEYWMNGPAQFLINDCDLLRSDEIPYLMAEKPPSESDSGDDSDVNCATSVTYEKSVVVENEPPKFMQRTEKEDWSLRGVDKITMAAWESDQWSDEYDDEEYLAMHLKPPDVIGNESDMEEFDDTEDNKKKGCWESFERDRNLENISRNEKVLNSRMEGTETNSSSKHSKERKKSENETNEDNENAKTTEEQGSHVEETWNSSDSQTLYNQRQFDIMEAENENLKTTEKQEKQVEETGNVSDGQSLNDKRQSDRIDTRNKNFEATEEQQAGYVEEARNSTDEQSLDAHRQSEFMEVENEDLKTTEELGNPVEETGRYSGGKCLYQQRQSNWIEVENENAKTKEQENYVAEAKNGAYEQSLVERRQTDPLTDQNENLKTTEQRGNHVQKTMNDLEGKYLYHQRQSESIESQNENFKTEEQESYVGEARDDAYGQSLFERRQSCYPENDNVEITEEQGNHVEENVNELDRQSYYPERQSDSDEAKNGNAKIEEQESYVEEARNDANEQSLDVPRQSESLETDDKNDKTTEEKGNHVEATGNYSGGLFERILDDQRQSDSTEAKCENVKTIEEHGVRMEENGNDLDRQSLEHRRQSDSREVENENFKQRTHNKETTWNEAYRHQSLDAQRQSDSLKDKEDNSIENATIELEGSKDIRETAMDCLKNVQETVMKSWQDVEEKHLGVKDHRNLAGLLGISDEVKCEEEPNMSDIDCCNITLKKKALHPPTKRETGTIPKQPNSQSKITMESVAMNLASLPKDKESQPDYEQGFYSYTLNIADVTTKKEQRTFADVEHDDHFEDISLEKTPETPFYLKSPFKSDIFVPAQIIEETRSNRNKLTKLLRSLKKKLTKKAQREI